MKNRLGFGVSVLVVVLATAVAWSALGREHLADVVMVYLLGTVIVSLRFGYGPSAVAAVLSVAAFNFFFIPPYYTFAVADLRHLVTFVVMLTVALVISSLEERLRERALRVETEQHKNALLSSVSHDLRTPLAVVTGAASTLLEGGVSDEVRRDLTETILQEADRLNRLVRNLLDMTRVDAGALQVKREWEPLEEVIGAALTRAERVLGTREVKTSLPDDITLVPIDSVLVEQVLVNLLENAAKYTPPDSPIDVVARVAKSGREVEIEVADRGPGLAPGEATKVFEKFHRGEKKERGAGLGLAICRGIVLAHGGKIWAEPRDGGGARFRFTLPRDGEPPKAPPGLGAAS